ncbi:MAG: hypothetical protein HYU77_01375 [Betaproteobacteria bacterium]|nr:hypothetical protein [Betaproteobacteria bacterium]
MFTAPATIPLAAHAADADGSVAKVEFFDGATRIASVTAAPYSFQWTSASIGAHTLTAVATDDRGAATTSAVVPVIVNAPPAIAFTGPSEGATFIAPATIDLAAMASDTDGTIARVEFFEGANLLAGMTQPPFSATWTATTPGSYTLFARATDDRGAVAQALPLHVTVKPNTPPAVSMTSPAQGASFKASATIALAATASDSDGSIAKVEFFQGATLIGTATTAPYSAPWTNVAAGNYILAAVATDDRGAQMISGSVAITVTAAQAQVYYIFADHLNTPRVITDQQQRIVWRWDNTDPFGTNVPDEDPDGDGQRFEFNLRFPGQYFDRETGLHYNYYRDCYDPATGRYCQPDPIGLEGGLNLYLYVRGQPLGYVDPLGLCDPDDYVCQAAVGQTSLPIPGVGALPSGFRWYGNWGGPGWTGGFWSNWNGLTPAQQVSVRQPIDSQDACYMAHDICFGGCRGNSGNICPPRDRAACFRDCDRRLSQCLANLPAKAPWNNWRARTASWYFSRSNPAPRD